MSKDGIQGLSQGRKDMFRLDPRDIYVRDGWNCRDVNFDPTDDEDLSLAQSIAMIGVKQSLTVVWEGGKVWLTDGHRRLAATLYAIDTLGAEIRNVPVQTEERYASEAERVLSQVVRNAGKPLTPIETSRVYKRLTDFGWSEKQIAESVGRSTQWVRQVLELNAAPAEVSAMVRAGQVSATLAMATLRQAKGDGAAAVSTLARAVASAQAAGRTKATAKHLAGPERFGNRRVPRMLAEINTLRRAIRAEGTPAIQEAWDQVEQHIDFAYQQNTTLGDTTAPIGIDAGTITSDPERTEVPNAADNGQDAEMAPPQWEIGKR